MYVSFHSSMHESMYTPVLPYRRCFGKRRRHTHALHAMTCNLHVWVTHDVCMSAQDMLLHEDCHCNGDGRSIYCFLNVTYVDGALLPDNNCRNGHHIFVEMTNNQSTQAHIQQIQIHSREVNLQNCTDAFWMCTGSVHVHQGDFSSGLVGRL